MYDKLVNVNDNQNQTRKGGNIKMPVEVVACMLADKNSWKRLQFQLILQCAPLFKGYKVACITNVRREDMRNMHLLLNGTGICYRALTFCRDKYLVLLYRPAQLKTYLKQPEVKTFLADYGYEENSLEKVLERLSLRVREHSKNEIEFPHEIGIFLNYPLEDVRGFIEHKGQDSLFCGYWKVYHDPEKAKLTFWTYDKAKDCAVNEFLAGKTIREIVA